MALIKKPTSMFENEPTINAGDIAVADEPQTQTVAAAPAAAAPAAAPVEPAAAAPAPVQPAPVTLDAAVATEVAITKASKTALATADAANDAKRFKREVEEMKGASDFSYGNYNVFKGNNGEIACHETKDSFGRWVKVRLLSWDDHTEISPGETGASTKDYVAYSKDGKVIDSVIGEELKGWIGKPVADYVEYLKNEEDFSKTKSRRFIDTACAVIASDSGDGPIGEVVQITLSESSIPAFAKHQENLANKARCVAMGIPGFSLPEDPFTFFFLREVASKGNNTWTKLRIVQDLPAKI